MFFHRARLALCEAIRIVLKDLETLGLSAPERM